MPNLFLTKVKSNSMEEKIDFLTNNAVAIGHQQKKNTSFNVSLIPYAKIKSQHITELNVK